VRGPSRWSGLGPAGLGVEDAKELGEERQLVEPAPQRRGTGGAVPLAPEKAADLRHPAHGLPQGGRRRGRCSALVVVGAKRLPLLLLEEDVARQVRGLSAQAGEIEHPPSDDPIQRQAGLEMAGLGEAAVLDAATGFEGTMKNLAKSVPAASWGIRIPLGEARMQRGS